MGHILFNGLDLSVFSRLCIENYQEIINEHRFIGNQKEIRIILNIACGDCGFGGGYGGSAFTPNICGFSFALWWAFTRRRM
jgi:hypothetical protein